MLNPKLDIPKFCLPDDVVDRMSSLSNNLAMDPQLEQMREVAQRINYQLKMAHQEIEKLKIDFPVFPALEGLSVRLGEAYLRAFASTKAQRPKRGRPVGSTNDILNAVLIEIGMEAVLDGGSANSVAVELIAAFGWSEDKADVGQKFFTKTKTAWEAGRQLGKVLRRKSNESR